MSASNRTFWLYTDGIPLKGMHLPFLILCLLSIKYVCVSEYLVCQFPNGTSCPKAVCPNTTLNFICNIETQQLGYTQWLLPNGTCRVLSDPDRIALLQPIYAGCNPSSSSQHGTCGPFSAQTVATSGCVNSSLSVIATQQLNGAEVKCMNYDGHNFYPVGNATISITAAPHKPNMSAMSSCTEIYVQWFMYFTESDITATTIIISLGAQVINTENAYNIKSLTFNNLVSDCLYTITYEASNCAGRSEVSIDIWTLPRPPQDIHASHVINVTTRYVHLVVTWTNQVQAGNNWSYVLNISSGAGQPNRLVQVSSDHCNNITKTCYYAGDLNGTANYFISMASVSSSRVGPFSDPVESVASTSSLLTININPATVTANLTCTFLDGQPYFCLVCCGSDLLSYPIKTLTNRGVMVGATIYGLMANHVYYCKASARVITNGTSCDGLDVTNASVTFSFKTLSLHVIVFQNSSKIQATVLSQDTNTAVIKCLFRDGQSHFCLVCCSSNSSLIAANVSTSVNTTVTVDLYGLGTRDATVLYCNASAQNVSQMNCNHHDVTTSAYAIHEMAAISDLQLALMCTFGFIVFLFVVLFMCLWRQCGKYLFHKQKIEYSVTMSELNTSFLMAENTVKEGSIKTLANSMYHPVEDSVKAGITTPRKTNEPLTTCNSKFEDEAVSSLMPYSYTSTKRNSKRSQLDVSVSAMSLYDAIPKDTCCSATPTITTGSANKYDYIANGANTGHTRRVKMSALL